MNALVIGLGSMGKRRIRCLLTLGFSNTNIIGFDPRADRTQEATTLHGVTTFNDFDQALKALLERAPQKECVFIISTPPDTHHIYMKKAADLGISFFVEASVVDTDMDEVKKRCEAAGIVAAPSSTLVFHPAIKTIKKIIDGGELGTISNVIYHSGQYLPDWHTYEAVSDYYVSNRATGGGREIVPFEMTWLAAVFGLPKRIAGLFKKTIDINGAPDIDDTYNILFDYGSYIMNLSVDVVSRAATRRMLINGEKKQLRWDWDDNNISIFSPDTQAWETISYDAGMAAAGYNTNIGEQMYIDEVDAFLKSAKSGTPFVNTLEEDHTILKILFASERSDKTGTFIAIEDI